MSHGAKGGNLSRLQGVEQGVPYWAHVAELVIYFLIGNTLIHLLFVILLVIVAASLPAFYEGSGVARIFGVHFNSNKVMKWVALFPFDR